MVPPQRDGPAGRRGRDGRGAGPVRSGRPPRRLPAPRHPHGGATASLSLHELARIPRTGRGSLGRLAALACFPEDQHIPYRWLARLWGVTELPRAASACAWRNTPCWPSTTERAYGCTTSSVTSCAAATREAVRQAHQTLLEGHAALCGGAGWHALAAPGADPAFLDNVTYHLAGALASTDLHHTTTDFRFLVERVWRSGPQPPGGGSGALPLDAPGPENGSLRQGTRRAGPRRGPSPGRSPSGASISPSPCTAVAWHGRRSGDDCTTRAKGPARRPRRRGTLPHDPHAAVAGADRSHGARARAVLAGGRPGAGQRQRGRHAEDPPRRRRTTGRRGGRGRRRRRLSGQPVLELDVSTLAWARTTARWSWWIPPSTGSHGGLPLEGTSSA